MRGSKARGGGIGLNGGSTKMFLDNDSLPKSRNILAERLLRLDRATSREHVNVSNRNYRHLHQSVVPNFPSKLQKEYKSDAYQSGFNSSKNVISKVTAA